jgi:hypothetical protein
MANYEVHRKIYYIKQKLIQHLKDYKILYIIGGLVFLLGFVCGVFTAIKYADLVDIRDITDSVLINFLKDETSVFGVFFSRVISYIFICVIIILINAVFWCIPLNYIFLFYKSFILAMNISFLIILFGFSGILISLLVLIPCQVIFNSSLISLISICVRRSIERRKFGFAYFSDCQPFFPSKTLYFICCLFLVCAVLELLLLPIISVTFIIIV